jgi:hypothetical protein
MPMLSSPRRPTRWVAAGLILAALAAAGCQRNRELAGQAAEPAQAIRQLARHLHDNDLVGYARAAVPPDQYAQLESAWRDGRSRWPLTEFPLAERVPGLLAGLAAPGAETRLMRAYDAQFAGQNAALRQAAHSLTQFGVQYLRNQGDYDPGQRDYYVQLVTALGHWAERAPLGDRARAQAAIARLAAAARRTGLDTPERLQAAGMEESLRRLGPFLAEFKQVLASYDLDLDQTLQALDAGQARRDGDTAQVRVRYPLAGSEIEFDQAMVQRGHGWYRASTLQAVAALLRQARPATAGPPAPAGS